MTTMLRSDPALQGMLNRADTVAQGSAAGAGRSIGEMLVQDESRRPGSLKWSLSVVRRRRWLFMVLVVATTALAVGYAVIVPPLYTATSQIMIDPSTGSDASYGAGGNGVDPMAVDSQVEVLKSHDIAQTVIRGLKPGERPAATLPFQISSYFRQLKPLDSTAREEALVETVTRNLEVDSLGLSSVISVSYRDQSADRAAHIANAFATAYITGRLAVKAADSRHLVSWLESQLVVLRENAARSEAALKEYQASNGLIGLQSSTGSTLAQQQINAMTIDLSRASDDEAVARGKLLGSLQGNGVGRAGRFDSTSDTLSSPVIQELERERNAASAKLAQLQSSHGLAYPEAVLEEQAIADIDKRRASEVERIHQSLQSALDVAASRTASLRASLNSAIAAAQTASRASGRESELQIQANADNDVYKRSLDRLKQTIAEAGTERADARIVSFATSPLRPSSTGRKVIVAFGALLGGAVGLIVIVGIELLFGRIYTDQQLADVMGVPCLGAVPEFRVRRPLPMRPRPTVIDVPMFDRLSGFSEMIRGVIATEPFFVNERRHLAVMLTSSVSSEGKSTTAIVLGRTMALQGIRVLVVDCDLFRRSMTAMLGNDVPCGLVEVIEGTASLETALQLDVASGMRWLGIRKGSGRAGTFANPRLLPLLSELRESFDIVLLDAAPLLATADARYLAKAADRLVVAVRWARTRPQGIRATMKVLDEIGVAASGAILTRVNLKRQSRMGDSSRYSYQKQYRLYRAH